MAKFVITKTVNLGFLGDDYKDSFITLRSITMRERDEMIKTLSSLGKDEVKSAEFVKDTILDRFVSGKVKQGDEVLDVTKEDLMDFPAEVFLEAIAQLQGRTDPKS